VTGRAGGAAWAVDRCDGAAAGVVGGAAGAADRRGGAAVGAAVGGAVVAAVCWALRLLRWRRLTLVQPSNVSTLRGAAAGGFGDFCVGGTFRTGGAVSIGDVVVATGMLEGLSWRVVAGLGPIGMVVGGIGERVSGTVLALPSRLRRMLVRLRSVAASLSDSGERGEPCEGFCRACKISRTPAVMRSVEEAIGILTLVGNQVTVSAIRSWCVFSIQARKHR
jgi:hypothetical protein